MSFEFVGEEFHQNQENVEPSNESLDKPNPEGDLVKVTAGNVHDMLQSMGQGLTRLGINVQLPVRKQEMSVGDKVNMVQTMHILFRELEKVSGQREKLNDNIDQLLSAQQRLESFNVNLRKQYGGLERDMFDVERRKRELEKTSNAKEKKLKEHAVRVDKMNKQLIQRESQFKHRILKFEIEYRKLQDGMTKILQRGGYGSKTQTQALPSVASANEASDQEVLLRSELKTTTTRLNELKSEKNQLASTLALFQTSLQDVSDMPQSPKALTKATMESFSPATHDALRYLAQNRLDESFANHKAIVDKAIAAQMRLVKATTEDKANETIELTKAMLARQEAAMPAEMSSGRNKSVVAKQLFGGVDKENVETDTNVAVLKQRSGKHGVRKSRKQQEPLSQVKKDLLINNLRNELSYVNKQHAAELAQLEKKLAAAEKASVDVSSYEDQIVKLRDELEGLTAQLDEAVCSANNAQNEISANEESRDAQFTRISELEQELQRSQTELTEAQGQQSIMLQSAEADRARVSASEFGLNAQLVEFQTTVGELQTTVSERDEEIVFLKSELTNVVAQVEAAQQALAEKSDLSFLESSDLQNQLANAEATAARELANAADKLAIVESTAAEQVAAWTDKFAALEASNITQMREYATLMDAFAQMEQDMAAEADNAKHAVAQLTAKMQAQQLEMAGDADSAKEATLAVMADMEKQIVSLKSELREFSDKASAASETHAALVSSVAEKEVTIDTQQNTIDSQQNKIAELEKQVDATTADLSSVFEENEKLTLQVNGQQGQVVNLEKQVAAFTSQASAKDQQLSADLTVAQSENVRLAAELESASKQSMQAGTAWENKMAVKDSEIARLNEQAGHLETGLKAAQASVGEFRLQNDELLQKLQSQVQKNDSVSADASAAANNVRQMEADLTRARHELSMAGSEKTALQAQLEMTASQKVAADTLVATVQRSLESAQTQTASLEQQVAAVSAELQQTQANATAQVAAMEQQVAAVSASFEQTQASVADQTAASESQLKETMAALQQAQTSVATEKANGVAMQAQLSAVQQQFASAQQSLMAAQTARGEAMSSVTAAQQKVSEQQSRISMLEQNVAHLEQVRNASVKAAAGTSSEMATQVQQLQEIVTEKMAELYEAKLEQGTLQNTLTAERSQKQALEQTVQQLQAVKPVEVTHTVNVPVPVVDEAAQAQAQAQISAQASTIAELRALNSEAQASVERVATQMETTVASQSTRIQSLEATVSAKQRAIDSQLGKINDLSSKNAMLESAVRAAAAGASAAATSVPVAVAPAPAAMAAVSTSSANIRGSSKSRSSMKRELKASYISAKRLQRSIAALYRSKSRDDHKLVTYICKLLVGTNFHLEKDLEFLLKGVAPAPTPAPAMATAAVDESVNESCALERSFLANEVSRLNAVNHNISRKFDNIDSLMQSFTN